ncbi:mitochondrial ribosomal protein L45 [Rhodnius prolixus]|uniref:Large ribosomal subunit protein mL45 n=2 Tax=Rhodnius TaxID=13248 RepID=A0A4P6D9H6_RHOPR
MLSLRGISKVLPPVIVNNIQIRSRTAKHWNPKFKKLRGQKFIKVELPNFEELNKTTEELSREKIRSKMKERGILPQRPWTERPVYISSTGTVFEPYVPPEGDGKVSSITKQGAKQKLEYIEKKSKSMMALRKIRSFEDEFEFDDFLKEAQDIYIAAHLAMINKDREKLPQFVTERAYPEVVHNIGDKTINWRFLESIQPPKVVHVRCLDVITKENIFSQITVRFHTQQILAVYDRFGRLIHGNEQLPKDVLEYVVFEKHLSNKYGKWRIHDKIIPSWMPPKEPSRKTHIISE